MTIAVDFDGVLHAYTRGWQSGEIYDKPVLGAAEGLQALMRRDAVFIFTARDNLDDVADWAWHFLGVKTLTHGCAQCLYGKVWSVEIGSSLTSRGLTQCTSTGCAGPVKFWDRRDCVLVTNVKLPASVYLDDRGVRFTSWERALSDVTSMLDSRTTTG